MGRTKNQLGLTLVEILATVVILLIISFFIFNIVSSSNQQNVVQSAESVQINDAAYLMKVITKDIRRTNELGLGATNTSFTLKNVKKNEEITYNYSETAQTLTRKGTVISNKIDNFKITNPVDGNAQMITIEFTLNERYYVTTLAFRKGNE